MEIAIRNLSIKDIDKIITVSGWVDEIRYQKKTIFFNLRDNALISDTIQCVGDNILCKEFCKETFVKIKCKVNRVPDKFKTRNGIELQVLEILYYLKSDSNFSSIVRMDSGAETKFDQRHLFLRDKTMRAYGQLTALCLSSLRKTFKNCGCTEIIPPLFGSVKCEGGSDVFQMDHLGTKVFMTQSSQMYLEATLPIFGRTFCIQPSFRAEKSHTKRHLTCFTHAECELNGFDTFEKFLDFLKNFINEFFKTILKKDKFGVLEELGRKEFLENFSKKEFMILSHIEAIKLLNEKGITKTDGSKFDEYDDIPESQERKLIDELDKIVLLTKFPSITKAFYSLSDPKDITRALACDVEFPGVGEIIGSSLREYDYDQLTKKLELFTLRDTSEKILDLLKIYNDKYSDLIKQINDCIKKMDAKDLKTSLIEAIEIINTLKPKDIIIDDLKKEIMEIPYDAYQWYFDLRKYGSALTGGFGLGVERMITWLAGVDNVKTVTMFPRFDGRLKP